MRIALVSPYSHAYPGGVTHHVEALRAQLDRAGHEARVLAPWDPDDRVARLAHGGVRPRPGPPPEHLVSLGRSLAWPINGSTANLTFSPSSYVLLSRELRTGGYDVVHVHEPNAPLVSWCAAERPRAPLVATFHCYSTNPIPHAIAKLGGARRIYMKPRVRIAVSEAARWTCERFYGGCYRVIPNGVDLGAALPGHAPSRGELRVLFLGRAEARKGLPVLLRAFDLLRAQGVPARLTIAGAARDEVEPLVVDPEGVEVRGRVSEEEKWRLLHEADVLCAPALGGESFGMVLTEAFAAGTPVVASAVAGYRQVVRPGEDGVLVPPGRARELAEALRGLHEEPARRAALGAAARAGAARFAWPSVAARVVEAYDDALATPEPARAATRLAVRAGVVPADGPPHRQPPIRRAPLDPPPDLETRRRRAGRLARRAGIAAGVVAGAGLAGLAVSRLGVDAILSALLSATPTGVLAAFALMCASLLVRAEAWHAILRAALPGAHVSRPDVARATMIGVLMSATLPARLGEPARALVVARALGRVRERLPVVLGTVVSQTLLNLLATAGLGVVMFVTVGLFRGGEGRLVLLTVLPVLAGTAVLAAPALLGGAGGRRSAHARAALAAARRGLAQARLGLRVFRHPRLGPWAAVLQLGAWAVQWLACWALLGALGLDERAGAAAAAAVLFAVNATAVLPVTPSNVGIYQAACVAVLSAYGVGPAEALAFGIILQALEMSTAVALGVPALVREGLTWRDMRASALHATPVPELRGPGRAAPAEA